MSSVLVTGATGFIGSRLCKVLLARGWRVRGTFRSSPPPDGVEPVSIADIGPETNWRHALAGVEVVVHLAARVHVLRDTAVDPLAEFTSVNMAGTERLAREMAASGGRRLVFVSSIKVNGDQTFGSPYRIIDAAAPTDPYGVSKWQAEQRLKAVADETGLEVVMVRPPIVYGPGVQANFLRLVRAVDAGIPLPFRSVDNARSLVFVGNLADLLARCAEEGAAAGRTFLVSDGHDLSTPDLVRVIARHLHRPARLLPVPVGLMTAVGSLLNRADAVRRLLGSLAVDIAETRRTLDWEPPFAIDPAMEETMSWYQGAKRRKPA